MTMQQDARRVIAEASAALEEFQEQAARRSARGGSLAYSDGVLLAVIPMIEATIDGFRGQIDDMDAEELAAVLAMLEPVVEIRRLALEARLRVVREREARLRGPESGP